jgi:type IV secretory pathway VirB2 component (pilin)
MFNKIKEFVSKSKAKLTALSLALAVGVMAGSNAFAAVDADVASTTTGMVTTMKENIVGVITTNISQIVIVGVIIFSIGFIWKLSRRFMK